MILLIRFLTYEHLLKSFISRNHCEKIHTVVKSHLKIWSSEIILSEVIRAGKTRRVTYVR